MSIGKLLLLTGIALTVVPVLLGHHCWFFAVEALVKLLAVALIFAGGL